MEQNSVFKNFPVLESDRLIFRAITVYDAKDILEIRSNSQVMTYMDSKPHESIKDSIAFIENGIETYQKGNGLFWAITDKKTGDFIGDFSFWRIDHKNKRGEIGYTLKPNYWGKGYMKETMQVILSFGLARFGLHSIEANINPYNDNSKHILLKM
jgi:ribosomal-protein-alanine N-acetyltransferase